LSVDDWTPEIINKLYDIVVNGKPLKQKKKSAEAE